MVLKPFAKIVIGKVLVRVRGEKFFVIRDVAGGFKVWYSWVARGRGVKQIMDYHSRQQKQMQ